MSGLLSLVEALGLLVPYDGTLIPLANTIPVVYM